jgi:hypothetical protein
MASDTQPSTIAEVETDTGRLVERKPLAFLVVWGARNERRAVVLERARADELAAVQHGQVVPLVAGNS